MFSIPRFGGLTLAAALSCAFWVAASSESFAFDNSLWVGTDNVPSRRILNMSRTGIVLQTVGPEEATGMAIDPGAEVLYVGTNTGLIQRKNLTTLVTEASFMAGGGEDMAFDGECIWRGGGCPVGPCSNPIIKKIDPMKQTWVEAFTVPYRALGIAWDGSGFWIGEYTGFPGENRVMRFDPSGTPTGELFTPAPDVYFGGLAFDTTDSTLFMGTFGGVYHYTRTGTQLGFFAIPAGYEPGRFVDALEFEGSAVATDVSPGHLGVGRALTIWPTPMTDEVSFRAETSGPIQLRIYDTSGRVVRELMDGGAGPSRTLLWDGRTLGGHLVPAGPYLVRLTSTKGFVSSGRVTLVR